jgi:hypothetical protein
MAAAEAASGPSATVAEGLGKVWLYAIAPQDWRPSGGERVTVLGPLRVNPGRRYKAHYALPSPCPTRLLEGRWRMADDAPPGNVRLLGVGKTRQ